MVTPDRIRLTGLLRKSPAVAGLFHFKADPKASRGRWPGTVLAAGATIRRGETITYCRGNGPNTITIRAVDTAGNASAFSNEIVFC
jgi:hypothetical protein